MSWTLLRARGGISACYPHVLGVPNSSPRTRRYFQRLPRARVHALLFSAHAEVFLIQGANPGTRSTLLRARGGISGSVRSGKTYTCSSPRTRRYFHHPPRHRRIHHLFSAHAEVFPNPVSSGRSCRSLLRARGGISDKAAPFTLSAYSSPRTRRYFRL